jgi:hypothetical protein
MLTEVDMGRRRQASEAVDRRRITATPKPSEPSSALGTTTRRLGCPGSRRGEVVVVTGNRGEGNLKEEKGVQEDAT